MTVRFLPAMFVVCMALAHGIPSQASDEEYLGREMNMSFKFSRDFWDVTSPQPGDYYWIFSQMTFDFYAVNRECSIDAFMVMERNKKGSVAAYTNSEKSFMDEMNVPASMGFESWGGRIVGFVSSQGPGQSVGTMRNRQATMGGIIFKNVVYSIVNNGNLLTFVISGPVDSWNSPKCSKGISNLLNSFELNGEPDPREKGIANYYERTTGVNPQQAPVSPGRSSSSASVPSSSGGDRSTPSGDMKELKSLVGKAIEQAKNGEDVLDTLYDLEDLILEISEK